MFAVNFRSMELKQLNEINHYVSPFTRGARSFLKSFKNLLTKIIWKFENFKIWQAVRSQQNFEKCFLDFGRVFIQKHTLCSNYTGSLFYPFLIGSFFNENGNCPVWPIGNTERHQCPWHMFQPSRFEREAPVIRGQLPFSRFFLKSPVLRWSWRYYQIYLNFFKSISLFTNSICKFWLPVTKLGVCVVVGISFFWWAVDPCQQKDLLFWY